MYGSDSISDECKLEIDLRFPSPTTQLELVMSQALLGCDEHDLYTMKPLKRELAQRLIAWTSMFTVCCVFQYHCVSM